MEQAQKNSIRCLNCRMHFHLCVCDLMPKFDVKTRLVVLMQRTEFNFLSNTGRFIPKILPNSEIRFRGTLDQVPLKTGGMIPTDAQPFVLFPAGNAEVLTKSFVSKLKKPMMLIIPDGNWRQAVKIIKRVDALHGIPKVILPDDKPSRYRLRVSPREKGVCTYEAIARAMGIIEGEEIQTKMEKFFDAFVDRVLEMRGKMTTGR